MTECIECGGPVLPEKFSDDWCSDECFIQWLDRPFYLGLPNRCTFDENGKHISCYPNKHEIAYWEQHGHWPWEEKYPS